ncbi:MAG TPA: hypothetical protein VH816_14735 [Gaiellaceae bacterium]
MSGDVHHVVDPAEQPEVAVLVGAGAVAGEVDVPASTPGNGFVAEPGFSVVTPGSGVIMIIPVSVCH